jgi:hypothetical protein
MKEVKRMETWYFGEEAFIGEEYYELEHSNSLRKVLFD